ncbi:InlB B-repeat-containing protein [Aquimarina rubra]|uniref:T9SS type A sorting domain-containing protein n=1 Tax=Aquimarina rubra TaxID=1920033 RepID=A0ABW5LAV2_9FLAO
MKTRILYVMLFITSVAFAQTQIFNGVPNARGLSVDDNYVYTMSGSTLHKIDHTQSSPTLETVATGFDNTPSNNIGFTGLNLAQQGTEILIPGGVTNKVGFASTTGSSSSKLSIVDASYVVFYYNGVPYFITKKGTFTSGANIRRYDGVSGNTVNTTVVATLPTAFSRISDATMDGDILYYVDIGGSNNVGAIYKIDLSQTNPTAQLVLGNIASPRGIRYAQDYLYFTRPTASGGILKIKADGTGAATAVGNSIPYAAGIAIRGRDIYVVNSLSGSAIYKYSDPTIQACDVPVNITVSGITNNSATISWDMDAISTSFDLVYVESGQPIGNGTTISNITTNSQILSNLVQGQLYDVYVKTYCSSLATDSGYSNAKTFLMSSTVYVDKDATGATNGTSWTDAFITLESALEVVASGAEIWVAEGAYTPSTTNMDPRQARFTIPNGAILYGGFNATETQLSQRDINTNITILSGDINGDDNANILDTEPTRQDNAYHVIVIEGNTKDVVVDGFTIANANSTVSDRAAIFTNPQTAGDEITATIRNCIIENNSGSYVAGYWSDMPNIPTVYSDVDFESCVVRNNFSRNNNTFLVSVGNVKARGSIVNSLFYDNISQNRASCLYIYSDSFEIINSTFANNTGSNGNVISIFSGSTVGSIENTIIYGNGSITPLELINGTPAGVTVNNSIIEGGQLGAINSDPLYMNASADDYTLQSGSPAVDTGSNTALPSGINTDLSGGIRIIGGTVDLGAYEYGTNSTLRSLTINSGVNGNVTPSNGVYIDGTTATITATPNAGYQFDGWSGDASGATNPLTITMDADKTVTALFSVTQRSLTINATNGSITTNPNPTNGTYDDGTSVILTATPDAGYQFDGWSGDASGTTNPLTITMDADKTVTALFSAIQRTLTITATNGSVTTNPNPTNGTYDDGTSVVLTATPDAGYQFDGWSGDASGTTNPLTITMDADKTVTGLFSQVCLVNIPDANLKAYLVGNNAINTNGDMEIQCTEASAYSIPLNIQSQNVADATGIQAFTSIIELRAGFNQLSTLDLTGMNNLEQLYVTNNQLNTINLSGVPNLKNLQIHNNQLTFLDVSNVTQLEGLNFSDNMLANIDLSTNANLKFLVCYRNQLTNLDVSSNLQLEGLLCAENQIISLDLSNNTVFNGNLRVNDNNLSILNVANGNNNNMGAFDATNNPNLSCITVDDISYSNANWSGGVDTQTSFSLNCTALSVIDNDTPIEFVLYPNPANEVLNIKTDQPVEQVEIYTLLGKKISSLSKINMEVDISDLSKGVYFINVKTAKGSSTKRFIKR